MPLIHRFPALILLAASPSLTQAWMPQYPPIYGGPPGYGHRVPDLYNGYPGHPGGSATTPYPAPWGAQAPAFGTPNPPGTAPAPDAQDPSPPGVGQAPPPWFQPYGAMTSAQIRITQEITDSAYLVRIAVGDGNASDVQVSPAGRALVISRTTDARQMQEDRFGDGRGYRRSFSFSRGSMSQRVGLPPDADLSRMTREEEAGTIVLRVPRTAH